MKLERHSKFVELIGKYEIDTQEELAERLREAGFTVTQATVSRDIRELALIKTASADGSYKYSIPSLKKAEIKNSGSAVLGLINDAVLKADYSGNTVVVKCHTGMAQAVCAKLDDTGIENVVGTLAGDDTIFILMRSESDAERLMKELNSILSSQ